MSSTTLAPPRPSDPECQGIIDSMAEYVAKNGPVSEELARQQNRDDPRYLFLFGGEFSDYYKFRLLFEIQNLHMIAQPFINQPLQQPMATQLGHSTQGSLEMEEQKLEEQISGLRKQIQDSEANLKAHEMALNSQKQSKVDALWRAKEDKRMDDLIKQVGLNISSFGKCLERLQESGSKETISNSKKWIFDNCSSDRLREIILTYLLHRVRERAASDAFRLHVLYLINDWAHYCQRKKQDSIRQMLSRYVPKLYAFASNTPSAITAFSDKLEKLLGVWEGHKYFDESCYKQLRNPVAVITTEQASATAEQHQLSVEVEKEISETLGGYAKQHKDYEQHMLTKIATLETKKREIREQIDSELQRRLDEERIDERRRSSRFDQQQTPHKIPSLFDTINSPPSAIGIPLPPGGGPVTPSHKSKTFDLVPKAPYYELPAGMIVPLVKLEDITYKPLKEKDLRLPPPEPPSEQLLRELDRFYSALQLPPPIDCIRDADGWEMNGLVEHYVKKGEQRTKLEAKLKEQGKTLEDAFTNKFVPVAKAETSEKRRRRSRSRSRSSSSSNSSSSRSRSSGSSSSGSSRSSSSSRSSPAKSRSSSPVAKRIRRSRSPTPEERPTFAAPVEPVRTSISFKIPQPLNRETNKGAQLMTKMGWDGKGLGVKEQGIEEPITGGEVRDKTELYRGLGSKPDIYEEYRKQMSTQMAKRLHKLN